VFIGSDPTCDIYLIGNGICNKHLRLYHQSHHYLLDICEGAVVERASETIKAFPPPPMNFGEITPSAYCRIAHSRWGSTLSSRVGIERQRTWSPIPFGLQQPDLLGKASQIKTGSTLPVVLEIGSPQ